MPTRTGYKPGVPCWVDLSSSDLIASTGFYEELFGWRAEFDPRPEAGAYGRFTQGGKPVAGIGPTFGDAVPSVWNTYFATDDAESAAERVELAGGRVVVTPAQIFGEGSMAVFKDPAGAVFMVWQPGGHYGARIVNEPVALCWTALDSHDPDAQAFYPAVFGWSPRPAGDGAGGEYTEWLLDGRPVAGMRPPGDRFLPDPPHWLVFFAVADCDVTVALAEDRGGKILQRPQDLPMGRYAVLADPQGAVFAAITPKIPN
ncbi:VOC family protein [Sphaerisporangium corydalis]|uniref:VOC family protein n=1 Tax=Sphaerisporangium corydalis TaxID=1441875 RepID=A0ABV9EPV7_9ACTN|nr:VOC family protein [Sphaerisporangium corydalis]